MLLVQLLQVLQERFGYCDAVHCMVTLARPRDHTAPSCTDFTLHSTGMDYLVKSLLNTHVLTNNKKKTKHVDSEDC